MCDCVLEAIGPKGHSFEAFTTSIVHMFMISKLKFYERSHWHCFPSYIGNHGVSPMFLFEGGRDHEQRLSLSFVAQTIQSIGLPIESNRVEQTPSVWWEWTRVFASLSPCELPPLECKKEGIFFWKISIRFVSRGMGSPAVQGLSNSPAWGSFMHTSLKRQYVYRSALLWLFK